MDKAKQIYFYSAAIVLASILYGVTVIAIKPFFFPLDDAYIILHNAAVLLTGVDHNYIGTSALYGTTSPVHLALTALFIKMGFSSPEIALLTLNWVYIVIYSIGICRLAILYQLNFIQTAFCLFLTLYTGLIPYQLLNGLETGLALGIITWTLVFLSEPLTDFRRVCILFLCATMPFIRPELFFFSSLIIIYLLTKQFELHNVLKYLGAILLFASPWLAWMFTTTGAIYPLTIKAKSAFFANALYSPAVFFHAIGIFINIISLPFTLLIVFLWTSSKMIGKIILGFMLIFLTVYLLTNPLLMTQNYDRYLYIFIPFLVFGCINGLRDSRTPVYITANMLLVFAFIFQIILSPQFITHVYIENIYNERNQLLDIIKWCKKNIPSNATILIQDAGYIAYASHYKLVDIVGLKSPVSLYYHQLLTYPSDGKLRTEAISRIAHHTGGEYLILTPEWEKSFHITDDLKKLGWTIKLLYQGVGNNGYLIYKISDG